jgi:hypothetical protein
MKNRPSITYLTSRREEIYSVNILKENKTILKTRPTKVPKMIWREKEKLMMMMIFIIELVRIYI